MVLDKHHPGSSGLHRGSHKNVSLGLCDEYSLDISHDPNDYFWLWLSDGALFQQFLVSLFSGKWEIIFPYRMIF
jgi:hypothetical protein